MLYTAYYLGSRQSQEWLWQAHFTHWRYIQLSSVKLCPHLTNPKGAPWSQEPCSQAPSCQDAVFSGSFGNKSPEGTFYSILFDILSTTSGPLYKWVHWDAPLCIHLSFMWGTDVRLVGAYGPFGNSEFVVPKDGFGPLTVSTNQKPEKHLQSLKLHFWPLEPQGWWINGPTSASNLIHLSTASGLCRCCDGFLVLTEHGTAMRFLSQSDGTTHLLALLT